MKTDKELVEVVAGNTASYSSRIQALDSIKDESVYKYLAENAKDDWIRLESAIRGGVESSLQLLKYHADDRISLEAAIELDDQQRLSEIVLNSEDDLLKEIAANYIDDEELLQLIIEKSATEKERVLAAFRLGNFSYCRQLMKELKDENLRLKMAQFLGDTEALTKLSSDAADKRVKKKAMEWLAGLTEIDGVEID